MAKQPSKPEETKAEAPDVSADALQQKDAEQVAAEQAAQEAENEAKAKADEAKAARGEVPRPDWQKHDYTGPMTIEMADWRRKNADKMAEEAAADEAENA